MKDCIFCKIVKGELPSYKVYEDELFYAFLDIHPWSKGHTVVTTKEHYETVWEYPQIKNYFTTVKVVREKLLKALKVSYVDMIIMGREVPHAHIHLVPVRDQWQKILSKFGEMADTTLSEDDAKEVIKKLNEKK